ncbi:MAG: helix-turn-helix domain-containing protein [Thermomicrobiales bacterium]
MCDDSLRRWWKRFLAEGREGLADRPRPGRPRKLPEEALVVLRDALTASPDAHGYPTTIWTIADLTDLLGRTGWTVSVTTVQRALHAEGYVYRRPRHDLAHRQDIEAVASAAHVLDTLQKGGFFRRWIPAALSR